MALNSQCKDKYIFRHLPSSTFFSNGSCLDGLEEQYGKADTDSKAITNVQLGDGVDALAEEQELEVLLKSLDQSFTKYMKEISAEKFTTDDKMRQWHPEGDQGKMAEAEYSKTNFKYLGAVVLNKGITPEFLSRIAQAA